MCLKYYSSISLIKVVGILSKNFFFLVSSFLRQRFSIRYYIFWQVMWFLEEITVSWNCLIFHVGHCDEIIVIFTTRPKSNMCLVGQWCHLYCNSSSAVIFWWLCYIRGLSAWICFFNFFPCQFYLQMMLDNFWRRLPAFSLKVIVLWYRH